MENLVTYRLVPIKRGYTWQRLVKQRKTRQNRVKKAFIGKS